MLATKAARICLTKLLRSLLLASWSFICWKLGTSGAQKHAAAWTALAAACMTLHDAGTHQEPDPKLLADAGQAAGMYACMIAAVHSPRG